MESLAMRTARAAANEPERAILSLLDGSSVEQEVLTYGDIDRRARFLAGALNSTTTPAHESFWDTSLGSIS